MLDGSLVAHVTVGIIGMTVYGSTTAKHPIAIPITSSSVREGTSSAYHKTTKQSIMFGGIETARNTPGGTWIFSGTSWQQSDPKDSPSPRAAWSMAILHFSNFNISLLNGSNNFTMVLFGGFQNSYSLNDT